MSYNLIPVLTVDDKKYNQPTQNEGGLYVVNKGVLQDAPSNKFYLYNPNTDKYYNVNEQTVSTDLLKQLTEYEQRLQNIGRITANTTDPTQVNSIADLASMTDTSLPSTLKFYKDVLTSSNPMQVIVDKYGAVGKATKDYIGDMIINPITSDDLSGKQKAVTFLNNFLVNLGETMDYATGANAIKALLQGKGLEGVRAGYEWNPETGRAQYDWNVETGAGGLVDFGANFALEFLSDPTNWITLGGKQAVKEILTSSVDDVASSMGLTANKQYIKGITKELTQEFGTTNTLKSINYRALFNLADDVDTDTILNINKALNASLEAKGATSQIKLINSVMGTSDYYEKTAFKAAMATSTLGLEAMAVKGVFKYASPWLKNKMGDILKYNGTNGEYKWSDYEKVYRDAEDAATVYNRMTKAYDLLPKEAADAATSKVREDILRGIQKVVDAGKTGSDETVVKLDELAKSKGFGGINDMYEYFVSIKNNVDGNVTPIVRKLEDVIKKTHAAHNESKVRFLNDTEEVLKSLVKTAETYNLHKEYKYNPLEQLNKRLEVFNAVKTNMAESEFAINPELFHSVESAFKVSEALDNLQYILAHEDDIVLHTQETINKLLEDLSAIAKLLDGVEVPDEIISVLTTMHLYAIRLLNGASSESDELVDLLNHATDAMERIDDTMVETFNTQWSNSLSNLSTLLFSYKTGLEEEAAALSDLIDLSGHKTAPIFEAYRAKDNMLASTALKEQLEKATKGTPNVAPDTKGAFIHPADFKQLDNVKYDITVDDCLPESEYTIDQLRQYLVNTLNMYDLYEVDEDIMNIQRIFENISDNKLNISVSDMEELIVILRRRANNLKARAKDIADQPVPMVEGKLVVPFGTETYPSYEAAVLAVGSDNAHKLYSGIEMVRVDVVDRAYYINDVRRYWFANTEDGIKEYTSYEDALKDIGEENKHKLFSFEERLHLDKTDKPIIEVPKVVWYYDTKAKFGTVDPVKSAEKQKAFFERITYIEDDARTFRNISDNLADYIDALYIEQYGKMFVDAKQLYSKLYAVKLSQAASLNMIINDPNITGLLNNILDCTEGIGAFIRTLEQYEGTAQAAKSLHALAESTYVYGELLKGFRESDVITDEWADALTDSLAGIMRMHISDVHLDDLTTELLDRSRLFINKSNSSLPNTAKYVADEFLPEKQADVLADVLFNRNVHRFSPDVSETYVDLIDNLNEGKEFNVVFSIGQHSKKAGVFEFVCELPEDVAGYGKKVHFVNDAVDYKAYYADPRYASEVLGQKSPVIIEGVYAPNAVHFDSTVDFVTAVNNFLETLKTHVNPPTTKVEDFRDIQFLGFGNSISYNNQNGVLRDFFRQYKINFSLNNNISSPRNAKCVDIKELIHLDGGAVTVSDELYNSVRNVLSVGKAELDSWNSKAVDVQAHIMPDISQSVLDAVDTLTTQLDNAVARVDGVDEALKMYSKEVLERMSGDLRLFSNNLSSNLKTVRESNIAYAKELIVGKVFNELSGEPNIMRYVTKYLVDSSNGGLSELSLKIYHDPDLVASWYDLESFKGKNVNELLRANELLKRLQRTSDSIARAELLYAPSSMSVCDEVVNTLRDLLKHNSTSTYTHKSIADIEAMRKGLMPEQTYAIAVHYAKEFNKLPEKTKDRLLKVIESKWETNIDAQRYFGLVRDAENTVLNKKGVYVPSIDSFKNMKFDESYGSVYHALETRKELMYSKRNVECLKDSLKLQDEVMSKHGVNSPVYKMQRSMIESYGRFIDTVTNYFDSARNEYLDAIEKTNDAVEKYELMQLYTKRIESYQDQLNQLAEYHTNVRTFNILNMDINTYEQYLFKYSQGVQFFDTSSKVLRSEEFSQNFIDRIAFINSTDNKTSLRVAQYKNYIVVYVDKNADAKHLENLKDIATGYEVDDKYIPAINMHFDTVPKYYESILDDNTFFSEYYRMQEDIEHTHNVAYSMSTHRAMNYDKLEELYNNLPSDLVDKLLSKDYWASTGLVQGGLVHNVVGDYNSGFGDLFTTYSGNIITNINSGFSKLYKQGVSREAYITLFTSPVNSLKNRVDMVNRYLNTTLTAEEVHEAVVEMGYKVASFTGKEIKLFDTSTEKGFKEALDKGAILIDAGLYDKVFRTMIDNSLPKVKTGSKKLDYIVNCGLSYMHLLKLGQLQSPGWIMRNIIDSTVKGAVASDANLLEYMAMIPTVVKKLREFDELVSEVYEAYRKERLGLSEFTIRRFFKEKTGVVNKYSLTLEQFLDYYNFSKNSASVPTPAQLNILNNVEQKLMRMFSSNSDIKEVHIRSLLKAYVDGEGNYKLTKELLENVYDDVTVQTLMNVFNKIPKGYDKLKDTNQFSKMATWLTDKSPLMKANNTVERMERFLAYDYNRMMGKTTGAAIDVVNTSQFNRAYDTVGKRMLEILFPFSAFQVDNMMFWINTLSSASGSVVGVLTDYLQAYQNEEELTPEEIATNASVQYMFLQGNIMLDDDGSLTLKTSDSLFNTMSVLADPIGYLSGAFNVPLEKVFELVKAINQDVEEYKADPYGKTKPISLWFDKEYGENGLHSFAVDFIPVFGAWWLRAQTSWEEGITTKLDVAFRQIAPSIFGRVKRTGYDWYGANNNEEYHNTHTFVPGISYIPSWLDTKNPMTYANTIQRLIDLGYDKEVARKMVVDWGYYMKAPDYVLKQFKPYQTYAKKSYPKKVYAPKPTYTKKVYPKKGYTKSFKMISGGDRYRTTRFGTARIYRLTSMYDRITKSGTSRMTMMLGRGHGASSIRVVRDRIKNNNIRRQRQRRILHM